MGRQAIHGGALSAGGPDEDDVLCAAAGLGGGSDAGEANGAKFNFRPPNARDPLQPSRCAFLPPSAQRERLPTDARAFYLATEGGDQLNVCPPWGCKTDADFGAELAVLAADGALRWTDVAKHVQADGVVIGGVDMRALMAVGDWVGMIEQVVCAGARYFLGSDRSTVSGGVLNLRQELFGSAHPFHLMPSK